jgi:hypothetical protein
MRTPKPSSLGEYEDWYALEHGYDRAVDRVRYGSAVTAIRDALVTTRFWNALDKRLREYEADYEFAKGFSLFVGRQKSSGGPAPELELKPWESLVEKTWRRNVLDNRAWPRPPKGGWITPDNWFERVGDLVRTSLSVRYLDGVVHLSESVMLDATTEGLKCRTEMAARREGYYAAHVDFTFPAEIPGKRWDSVLISARAELQITTQLQEVIRTLLHIQYEHDRTQAEGVDWEWDYRSTAFSVKYLGHVLHYLEGKIMLERDRPNGGT